MSKYLKTGLLVLTLVVPVLVFVFLKVFTTNHYDLPYYVPTGVSASGRAEAGADTTYYQLPDSLFLDSADAALPRGGMTVLSTFVPPCDDTCRLLMENLERVKQMRSSVPGLSVISLVPESTPVPRSPAGDAGSGWYVIELSDSNYLSRVEEDYKLSQKLSGSQTIPLRRRFSLVDSAGYIRGFYDAADREEIDRLMAEIRILAYNQTKRNR